MKEELRLERQGFYCEMPHGESGDPSIKEYIGKNTDVAIIDKICNYLNSGIVLVVCCGFSRDVVKNDDSCAGCPSLLTDGQYAWPGDLSYYVKKYQIELDPGFIEAMRKNEWTIPISESEIKDKKIYVGKNKLQG